MRTFQFPAVLAKLRSFRHSVCPSARFDAFQGLPSNLLPWQTVASTTKGELNTHITNSTTAVSPFFSEIS
jgi:hypothetical protein